MIQAKRVIRVEDKTAPDVAEITAALNDFEAAVKGAEGFSGAGG